MAATRLNCALVVCVSIATCGGTVVADDWPQWRGPHRDARSAETGLLREWPEMGPKVVWQTEKAGVGYSSLVVKDGRIITMGDIDGVEHILAFDEKDGSQLWAVQPEPVARALDERVEKEFARFDKNGDGKLDELEAMNSLGWNYNRIDSPVEGDKQQIANGRVKSLFALLDENKDGQLSFDEMPPAMQREISRIDREDKQANQEALAAQRAKKLIASADKNSDGQVSQQEARNTPLNSIFRRADLKEKETNEGDRQLTEKELAQYFSTREAGRDGQISATELEQHFAGRYPGHDGFLVKSDLRRFYGGFRNGTGDGPRGTPTIDGDFVYAEGGNGDLSCLDAKTGKTVWHLNLSKDLAGGRPGWGFCESPLVVDQLLIVTPGGKNGTLAALNKKDGSVVWRSEQVTQSAHYSSPQLAEIAGVKQIVQFSRESVYGVRLEDGQPLWSYKGAANGTANIATPIIDKDFVLATSAYNTGAGLVKVTAYSKTELKSDEVYFEKKMANHHGGLVKVGDYVYGFSGGLICMNFLTGEFAWRARSVSKGSLLYADGMLYCLGEGHEVALVEATPEEYRERGRFRIEKFGRPAWAHPVVANGRFYVRNQQRITAYDVKAASAGAE